MHRATRRFWHCYDLLLPEAQRLADHSFALLKCDSRHPSLHFKKVGKLWSVRVGIHYRALAVADEAGFLWVWIGTHAEYDRLISGQ
ncbi:MAG: hypothetical protein EPN23_10255 [Verrucomicrobia bacterium]|nr:MAG: hypothetical protein EPN23_10255 [Verrucomicrobiota bacterium]